MTDPNCGGHHGSTSVRYKESTSSDDIGGLKNDWPTVLPADERAAGRRPNKYIPEPSHDDHRDPLNWSMAKKITIFAIMIYGTFCGIATAVANVLATPEQATSWGVSPTQAAYSVSAVLAGIIIGPVLLVPLVRVFGAMSCCFWSSIVIAITSIWSAVSTGPNDYGSFIASRFVAGLFCGTAQVFTGGVIANIFFLHQRGKAFAIYSSLYMIAQVGGPTFSGYIVQFTDSWSICFWWTVGANTLAAALFFLLGEDTSWDRDNQRPLARKVIPESWWKRRFALYFPGTSVTPPDSRLSIVTSLKATLAIGFSPVTVFAGIYGLISFGWFIMVGVQIPIVLQQPVAQGGYAFSPEGVADFYFSAWIGAGAGIVYGVLVNDRLPLFLQRRNGGTWRVEYRLHTAWLPGLIVGPLGCGLFGASLYYHWHYLVLAMSEVFIVFAAVACVPPQTNYIIEIWRAYPQEVSAALNVWRIGFAISVQFFYGPWVSDVGVQWVWGTAALISLFGFGCVVVLMFLGPRLRRLNLLQDGHEERPEWAGREAKAEA